MYRIDLKNLMLSSGWVQPALWSKPISLMPASKFFSGHICPSIRAVFGRITGMGKKKHQVGLDIEIILHYSSIHKLNTLEGVVYTQV